MGKLPDFQRFYPAFFMYSTAFDFRTGNFNQNRHIFRILLSVAFLVYTIYRYVRGDHFSFALVHDGLFTLMYFLAIDLALIFKQNEISSLLNFITEPVKIGKTTAKSMKYQKYLKTANQYGFIPLIMVTVFGIIWPLVPSFVSISGYSVMSVDLPVKWITNPDSTWKYVMSTIFIVLLMVSNVALVQGWFLIMVVGILKLDVLTEILVDDLKNLDGMAEERSEELLDSLHRTGRLPQCQGCRERVYDITKLEELSIFLDFRRRCCRKAYRDTLLEDCHVICVKYTIIQHQRIIRISRLLDNVYRLTTWTFSSAAILILALVFPQLEKVWERSMAENIPAFLELLGTPYFFILFCYSGEYLYKQAEKIRSALYSCSWTDKSILFRKMEFMMQTAAKRDMCLTAGGLYTLNVRLLPSIFQSVYAYFKVLQFLKQRTLAANEN